MKNSTKIAKESLISFFGMGLGDAILYIYVALLARLVGLKYLGIYSLANSITRIAEVFGKVGLDAGIIRFIGNNQGKGDFNQNKEDIRSTLKFGLLFSVVVMLVQVLIAGWLVKSVFHGSSLQKTVIILNALTLPFCVLTILAAAATQGFQLLKYKVFVTNILTPIVMLIVMVGSYYLLSAEMTIVVPVIVSSIIGVIAIFLFLRKMTGIRLFEIFKAKSNFQLLKFSYPLMFVAAIDTLLHWMDIMMIGHFSNAEAVGLYYPAIRTTSLLRMILVSMMSISMPMISQLFSEGKIKETGEVYKLTVRWIMTLAIPLTIFLIQFPEKVMLLFGSQYVQAANVLVITTAGIFVLLITGIGSSVLTVCGYPKYNLINSITAFLINFTLNSIWIPKYGIAGAAWATFVTYLVFGILRSVEVWRIIRLQPLSLKMFKSIIAGSVTYVLILFLKRYFMPFHTIITLLLAGLATVLIYVGILYLFKFDADDKEVWNAIKILGKTAKNRQPVSFTKD